MKKLLGVGLALVLMVALAAPALAATTVYTNKAAWAAAVPYYQTEDFSDATLNPGVSVVSTVGYVHGSGYWWDRVDDGDWYGDGIVRDTTWSFATPITAWGGTFDAAGPGGPGSSIEVELIDGTPVNVGIIPAATAGTFWGFVSTVPFVKVHLKDAALAPGACETYHMDDMVYTEEVEIDIKPWSDPNSINPKSKGVIPVAILGSSFFDVTLVDTTTLSFGPGGATPVRWAYEDVNGDGYMDLVSHYKTQETGISAGDSSACLTGSLTNNVPFVGCDSVIVVPADNPGKGKGKP